MSSDEPVAIPITGELDLHTFSPKELSQVLDAYFSACLERQIYSVRVIHGKGTGTLKASVHALLQRMPEVVAISPADTSSGGWGATWVTLRKPAP